MSNNLNNPLLCDPETGVCEIPGAPAETTTPTLQQQTKPVKITYYTDPICSSCWGIEPQLRKLKLEYGDLIEIDYRMGGLLPDWSYNSGGISKPTDVAPHWEEVSAYYEMPIDGDVWLIDPLDSSYPPSIAVKAAQIQDKGKAISFMRRLREMLFLDHRNIARWEVIREAAGAVGLDTFKLLDDYNGQAQTLFREDLAYARQLGVRGFPTIFFSDKDNNQLVQYGVKPYAEFEKSLLRVYPQAKKEPIILDSDEALFSHYPTLTPKEYAVITDVTLADATAKLEKLLAKGKVAKQTIKTGVIYRSV